MKQALVRACAALALAFTTLAGATAQQIVNLWDGEIPGSKTSETYKETIVYADKAKTKPRVAKVTEPTLEVYKPKGKGNRAAIIICPGGGYGRLSYDDEGRNIAKAFAQEGFTAFVLKYRLPSDEIMEQRHLGPLSDAQRAIRLVRSQAKKWNVDPNKIGIAGFSAGGNLAATASTLYDMKAYETGNDTTSARPDFSILGYPVVSLRNELTHKGTRKSLVGGYENEEDMAGQFSADEQVKPSTPPAFMVHCYDDPAVPAQNSIRYYEALKANGISAEMHIFRIGGHGFGLGTDRRAGAWFGMAISWIKETLDLK